MKQVKCDICGKTFSQFPAPYGSGYKNISYILKFYSNYPGSRGIEYDFCNICGGWVESELGIFIVDITSKVKARKKALAYIRGLPTHDQRLKAQQELEVDKSGYPIGDKNVYV